MRLLALLFLAGACSTSRREVPPLNGLTVIDSGATSSVWTPMADSVTVYRMRFVNGSAIDTLTDVLEPLPIAVGPDTAAGLRRRGHA